ncbi:MULTISPECIES: hypothetical protein [Chromohalobacter]|uniref:hypothetical protein n=1 Tax=Chromohalobacter TaxID=42054 RepID=UPI0012EB29F5|nr:MULTISPECIES: hypothetical protein [Chromohalobacter]MBZ5874762.1 hypothetical protein [Chromohalobacter salexigens]MDF9433567.1 hypothetical protein [Chromohalobacter israelensis]MDO0946387.1 hypothetical protein [Chromohalobacter salexigens]NQY46183.1 hypothetical protein [Chromohalobacter sp.]
MTIMLDVTDRWRYVEKCVLSPRPSAHEFDTIDTFVIRAVVGASLWAGISACFSTIFTP